MTLIEFLLACLNEDEATADRVLLDQGDGVAVSMRDRVLADVAAKRSIVEQYAAVEGLTVSPKTPGVEVIDTHRAAMHDVVRLIATTYADRPGYDDEWRP